MNFYRLRRIVALLCLLHVVETVRGDGFERATNESPDHRQYQKSKL